MLDAFLHVAIGIGLSAAAGFRILIPFLFMSIAANTGYLKLAPEMAWMGSQGAIVAFAIAATVEVLIYFIPVLNDFLDLIEIPLAAIAGTILTATVTSDLDPFLRWSLALIGGGAIAGGTGAVMGFTRLGSTAVAGPMGNIAVSTAESVSSAVLSILAIAAPILVLLVVTVLLFFGFRQAKRRWG